VVTRQKKTPLAQVGNAKREHAPKPFHARHIPLLVCVEDDFRVGGGSEPMSGLFQFASQVLEIVDFAVVRHEDHAILVGHGLLSAGGIDDCKPSMTECEGALTPHALTVRSAVAQGSRHGFDPSRLDRRPIETQYARNTAHGCF